MTRTIREIVLENLANAESEGYAPELREMSVEELLSDMCDKAPDMEELSTEEEFAQARAAIKEWLDSKNQS